MTARVDVPALETLPDGVVIADAEQRVTVVNGVAARLLRLDDRGAVGKPLADVLGLQDQDGNSWYACNAPYDGLRTRTGIPEQVWLLPDGAEVLVTARIRRPSVDQDVAEVALCLRSGRGRARLDRERSDLVATIAHELRSPLTGVKGFVQALLNRWDKLSDDQKQLMLRTVNADAERLTRLIAELLDVARIDTGRLSLFPRLSDVTVLAGRVVASVSAGTSRPIRFEPAEGLPSVFVDPDKFTQVVTNLVENGVRHGEGTVTLTARPVADEADFAGVVLEVQDEGTGIPAEIRARVFTKFWRHGHSAGTGLGMYLVHGLVRAHGGSVTIGDAPGGGARVTLVWPEGDRRHR